jgi:hypothetical protein
VCAGSGHCLFGLLLAFGLHAVNAKMAITAMKTRIAFLFFIDTPFDNFQTKLINLKTQDAF